MESVKNRLHSILSWDLDYYHQFFFNNEMKNYNRHRFNIRNVLNKLWTTQAIRAILKMTFQPHSIIEKY